MLKTMPNLPNNNLIPANCQRLMLAPPLVALDFPVTALMISTARLTPKMLFLNYKQQLQLLKWVHIACSRGLMPKYGSLNDIIRQAFKMFPVGAHRHRRVY